jgi:pimeloyl-ACP methyl ester carboxylesterase
MTTTTATGRRVRAGDIELYTEVDGDGPTVLLIPGGGGDAGMYAALRDELAPKHTVVTYDRRSNSRSSRPESWLVTTVEQQADDASALLAALGKGPATVLGNSMGAGIALSLATRHPEQCAQVLVHEPALMAVLADPDGAMAAVQPAIGAGMAAGGMSGGAEAFFRFADETGYQAIPGVARERMLANAQVLFEAEFGSFANWVPAAAVLASGQVPIAVLVAERTAPLFEEAAAWLAGHCGTTVSVVPGGHLGFADRPLDFAKSIATSLP